MAVNTLQKAAQLKQDKARIPKSSINPKDSPIARSNSNFGDAAPQLQGTKASPSRNQQTLKLAKSLATGQRDKSKSLTDQAIGEVAARGSQALGGAIGSAIPVVGSAAGAAIGKRAGRIAGENWKKTLVIMALSIFFMIVPYLVLIAIVITIILASAEQFNLL